MRIGYACITLGEVNIKYKTCFAKDLTDDRLLSVIAHNLQTLKLAIEYNIKNHIQLFRISSDIIPFGSSDRNTISWWDVFQEEFRSIGELIRQSNMRVSMHPGQYTVLNSNNPQVVERAILDLQYHTRVLNALGLDTSHKIILHIGGVYGDKNLAIQRFMKTYQGLDSAIRDRLVIENDDRSYTIEEVLAIGKYLGIPVVFDNLHHKINPSLENLSDLDWIRKCKETWKPIDGVPKIHYSQQDSNKQQGAHSPIIYISEFMRFYETIQEETVDIMLEVKDKNFSTIKCINAISKKNVMKNLEKEWSLYKYAVLEHSHKDYLEIRELLKDKKNPSVMNFYEIIERSLAKEVSVSDGVNAALHIWGYFKIIATSKEKRQFLKAIDTYKVKGNNLVSIKNQLLKLAITYEEGYISQSYYFYL